MRRLLLQNALQHVLHVLTAQRPSHGQDSDLALETDAAGKTSQRVVEKMQLRATEAEKRAVSAEQAQTALGAQVESAREAVTKAEDRAAYAKGRIGHLESWGAQASERAQVMEDRWKEALEQLRSYHERNDQVRRRRSVSKYIWL